MVGNSQSLMADALDFLGDTATYTISLLVIGCTLRVRASAALFKGITLAAFGIWILGSTFYQVFVTAMPQAAVMGSIATLALTANVTSALLLFKFRNGDANVRSVWLCSRNDAIGNVAVILAASGVWISGTGWPDLIVAGIIATLFLRSAIQITRSSLSEYRSLKFVIQPH